ncbi:N-acetylmuramoyl-L-alanine amidase [bacterium]|nr:N-acetylmuramoyl-L-alanine amidase [bacterium]
MAVRLDSIQSFRRPSVLAGGGLQKPAVTQVPSPNHNDRPGGSKDITAVVLHHTSGGTLESNANYFKNPSAQVSSHYIVGKDGRIVQSVQDGKRSWHAGTSEFKGRNDVNDFSLGIEIVNAGTGSDPFPDSQYKSVIDLVAWMCQTYNIPVDRITGHKDIALPRGRKNDPAPNFDWNRVRSGVQAKLQGGSAPAAKPAAPAQPVAKVASADQGLYSVKDGDTLWGIAKKHLGNGSRWPEIYDLNKDKIKDPNVIGPGMVLRMPGGSKPVTSAQGTYTVKDGDTLYGIAKKLLGDGTRWPELYNLNKDKIKDPNVIYPGLVLRLSAESPKAEAPKPEAPKQETKPAPAPEKKPEAPKAPDLSTCPIGTLPTVPGTQPTKPAQPPVSQPKPPVTQPTKPVQPPVAQPKPPITKPAPQPVAPGEVGLAGGLRIGGSVAQTYLNSAISSGGIATGVMNGGFLYSIPGLLKSNVAVAAVVSGVTNALDFIKGRVTGKQAAAGFAADTVAYTGIGATSTAIGAAVGSVLGPVGTVGGFLVGSAVGMGLSWAYEKFGRSKIVGALTGLFGK